MLQGVFLVFRRRLSVADAIRFANPLLAVLRALFVADWDTNRPPLPFGALPEMNEAVRQLRPEHNFSTDTAIQDVGWVLKKHVDEDKFRAAMQSMPVAARQFWQWHG